MKNVILTILAIAVMGMLCPAYAADVSKTLTFAWQQDNIENAKEWRLFWGDQAGGPYNAQEIAIIPYSGGGGPEFTSPATAMVTGNPGTTIKKYFVLRACGDVPQQDGSTKHECSENSNEISYDFWIAPDKFSAPVEFQIIATPQ